jgi:EmrB/QacA subfamily drug resistance transporter
MIFNIFLNRKWIGLTVSLALFMEALDTTIINTAIPAMSQSLHVNPVNLKIALISYLLSLAIFIPISGWVADKFGIKQVFMTAVLVFTLSSIWCGFAHNLYELVIARILQGLGGSLTIPVGRLILLRVFARHELINAMSRVIMVAAVGMMLGPVLGGYLTHYLSWQWIFWVNIPVGIATMSIAFLALEKTPAKRVPALDKWGFVFFGSGLATLTFGLSALSESNLSTAYTSSILITSILLLTAYVWHSRHQKYPIVDTHLFNSRAFKISVLGNLASRLGFGGAPFLLPLMFQIGLGYPVQISGLLLAPMALGVLMIKPFSLYFLRLFGYKRLLIINTMLVGFALWTFTFITNDTSLINIACMTFIYGFLISLQYSGMNSLAYADIQQEHLGAATSIMSTMQQLAQSFGVAVSALLIQYFSPGLVLTTIVFHQTFFMLGCLTLMSILVFVKLKANDGEQMIHRPLT